MKWVNVKWIYLREIRDQLRDRRTLFTIFVLPVLLYPLLGMGFLQIAQFSREHLTPVLILGAESLPEDPRLIEGDQFVEASCPPEEARLLQLELASHHGVQSTEGIHAFARSQIESGKFDAVVFFPPDFATRLAQFRAESPNGSTVRERTDVEDVPEPAIFVNSANDKSRIAKDRIERVLYRWRQSMVNETLKQKHVSVAATEPFRIVKADVARESTRRAAVWSKILPFIVLVWALTGAFYPAIDLCAGEKERGTLETLLCSPAQRIEIVWGKLLTIMTFSMATSLLNLVSLGATGSVVIRQFQRVADTVAQPMMGTPPLHSILWLVVALIPLSALFSALSLAIAAFARSSREGQYYLMPVLFVTLPLMMLSLMPTAELDLGTSLIPVTGVMLLLRSMIEGHYWESLRFALPVVVITGVCCWLAIGWAVRQFNNESVLFRESERWGLGIWMKHLLRDRADNPSLAESLFCGVLLLLLMRFFAPLFMSVPHDWRSFTVTTTVTLIAFVAAPALIMSLILTRSPRDTLLLRLPSVKSICLAALLAVVIHPTGVAVSQVVSNLYPLSPAIEVHVKGLQAIFQQAPNFVAVLAVLAFVPAVCEELAFRGFILSGMRQLGNKWTAIIGSAAFFGATHAFVQQSLSACALGVVLAYIAVHTRSLLPGLTFHFMYNALSLTLGIFGAEYVTNGNKLRWLLSDEEGSLIYHWPIVAFSLIVSGVILWALRGSPERQRALPPDPPIQLDERPEPSFDRTESAVHAVS
jgi:sodium transport system permease protein